MSTLLFGRLVCWEKLFCQLGFEGFLCQAELTFHALVVVWRGILEDVPGDGVWLGIIRFKGSDVGRDSCAVGKFLIFKGGCMVNKSFFEGIGDQPDVHLIILLSGYCTLVHKASFLELSAKRTVCNTLSAMVPSFCKCWVGARGLFSFLFSKRLIAFFWYQSPT